MADEARNNRGHEGGNRKGSGYGHSGGFHRGGNQGHGAYKGHGSNNGHYGSKGSGYRSDRREDNRGERSEGYHSNHRPSSGNFHRDDRSGYRGHDDRRSNYRGRDDRRSGYQGRDDRREGYQGRDEHKSGYQGRDDRRSGYRGQQRDDRRSNYGHGERDERRGGHGRGDRDDRRGGFHRNNDDRRGGYRRDDTNERYERNGHDDRRGGYQRDNNRGSWQDRRSEGSEGRSYHDQKRDGNRSYGHRGGQERSFHRDDRRQASGRSDWQDRRGQDRRGGGRTFDRNDHYQDGPRKNSDGTISYPSQNPYTDPRPGEPKMPKGLEWSMLSKDDKERLRGLSKEHAENTGLHILAAYALEETEPDRALAHAKWVARQASRVDIARETLALIAYRQGDYKLALREFRTAYRMNGYLDYLPFIADCERGLGHPRKAIEEATSEDAKALRGESKAEMFLVYAGALADLGLMDQAIETVHQLAGAKGLTGDYRMRALQAEQNFLDLAGRSEQSQALDPLLDKLEAEYADADEDEAEEEIIIDNDLEHATFSMLESLNIDPDNEGTYATSQAEVEGEPDSVADAAEETASSGEQEASEDSPAAESQSESGEESEAQA